MQWVLMIYCVLATLDIWLNTLLPLCRALPEYFDSFTWVLKGRILFLREDSSRQTSGEWAFTVAYFVFKFAELYAIVFWESEAWRCSAPRGDSAQQDSTEKDILQDDAWRRRLQAWCIIMAFHLFKFARSDLLSRAAEANVEHELQTFIVKVDADRKKELHESQTFDMETGLIIASYGLEKSQVDMREEFKR